METAMILADSRLGQHIPVWLPPLIVLIALVFWLGLTINASFRRLHPRRRHDQSPHRGPVEGGLYHYSPGMYSHSYPPGYTTPPPARGTSATRAPTDRGAADRETNGEKDRRAPA